MSRFFVSFIIIFTLNTDFSYSQYTEIINSNRPGNSSGAFSVGKNILQLENGFFYTNEQHQLLNYKVKGFGTDFKVRYGFLYEKLELIVDGVYQSDRFTDNRYSPSNNFNRKNVKISTTYYFLDFSFFMSQDDAHYQNHLNAPLAERGGHPPPLTEKSAKLFQEFFS